MSKKFKWVHQKKTQAEIPYETPVWLGNLSNGEFFLPQSERKRKLRETILQKCDDNARKLGMDRREFIASTMGMATTLSVLNFASGCGNKEGMMDQNTLDRLMAGASGSPYDGGIGNVGGGGGFGMGPAGAAGTRSAAGSGEPVLPGAASGGGNGGGGSGGPVPGMGGSGGSLGGGSGGGGGSDGGFVVTPEMCMDEALADKLFKTDYFILDFQTHHTNTGSPGPVYYDCTLGAACTSPEEYVRLIFEESETTVAVLSGLPSEIDEVTNDLTGPFSFRNEDMRNSRDRVNKAAMLNAMAAERMVAHCQISPKNNPEANARMMTENKQMYDTRGWKCYPPTEGGWFLHENDAFIKTANELGEPLVCVHKGFPFAGWSRVHADPMPDNGVTALRYPDTKFVVYHSAYDSGHVEGEYNPNPDADMGGTDRLWKVIQDNQLYNKNVFAEMGSAWAISMMDPVVAQHYIGKALKFMGEDRVVWGSECVWFGSPQNQIEAMKVFQISKEFQDKYGYPEFTDTIRRKIFGLTGATLYRVDPNACRYKVARSGLMARKMERDDIFGPRRHAINPPAIRTRRQFLSMRADMIRRGELG
ncbi:MAG: amidohydrolase family protein [Polyangiales bacterium]